MKLLIKTTKDLSSLEVLFLQTRFLNKYVSNLHKVEDSNLYGLKNQSFLNLKDSDTYMSYQFEDKDTERVYKMELDFDKESNKFTIKYNKTTRVFTPPS